MGPIRRAGRGSSLGRYCPPRRARQGSRCRATPSRTVGHSPACAARRVLRGTLSGTTSITCTKWNFACHDAATRSRLPAHADGLGAACNLGTTKAPDPRMAALGGCIARQAGRPGTASRRTIRGVPLALTAATGLTRRARTARCAWVPVPHCPWTCDAMATQVVPAQHPAQPVHVWTSNP